MGGGGWGETTCTAPTEPGLPIRVVFARLLPASAFRSGSAGRGAAVRPRHAPADAAAAAGRGVGVGGVGHGSGADAGLEPGEGGLLRSVPSASIVELLH